MFEIRRVMGIHAGVCVVLGVLCVGLPHSAYSRGAAYSHLAHEYLRLYGCLQLAVGWIVYRCAELTDGRLLRSVSEAFAVCYIAQGLVMARAQFTDPFGHRIEHWIVALMCLLIGALYAVIRFFKKIKDFDLPRSF
jgi:uncharacterized protein YjeT (DUF2065 family)